MNKIEKKRINISSKRQVTIPAKYFNSLGLEKELDCICYNGMLILTPAPKENSDFNEEILKDLIKQGLSGEQLLYEFKKIKSNLRPAVEKLIEEADKVAESSSVKYLDITDDIFGDD